MSAELPLAGLNLDLVPALDGPGGTALRATYYAVADGVLLPTTEELYLARLSANPEAASLVAGALRRLADRLGPDPRAAS